MKRYSVRVIISALLPLLILSSCAGTQTLAPPSPSEAVSPPPSASPAVRYHVKTDYSGLTAYKPLEEKYTRLTNDNMPELIPSTAYGKLLPYIGASFYTDFSSSYKYGLMTEYGMLVTDPVYDDVYRPIARTSSYEWQPLPVYDLEIIKEPVDPDGSPSYRHAVCALDGSWCTGYDFTSVSFYEKVMVLIRDAKTNDFDVMNYNGRLLYTAKSLKFFADMPPHALNGYYFPDEYEYEYRLEYGDGRFALPLTNGKTVYFDALTGKGTTVDYSSGSAFSGGYAAVRQYGLTGYIDESFNIVLRPQYLFGENFINGKAIVMLPDSSYGIIDPQGNVLMQSSRPIYRQGNDIFCEAGGEHVTYYDNDLNEIRAGGSADLSILHNGWFWYKSGDDVVLFRGDEAYTLPGVDGVGIVTNGLVTVHKIGDRWLSGVMALDGSVVVPIAEAQSISLFSDEASGKTYIIVTYYGTDWANSNERLFKLFDATGKVLLEGVGDVYYDSDNSIFTFISETRCEVRDTSLKTIVRLSRLQSVPD
jgi:hypothetical protein